MTQPVNNEKIQRLRAALAACKWSAPHKTVYGETEWCDPTELSLLRIRSALAVVGKESVRHDRLIALYHALAAVARTEHHTVREVLDGFGYTDDPPVYPAPAPEHPVCDFEPRLWSPRYAVSSLVHKCGWEITVRGRTIDVFHMRRSDVIDALESPEFGHVRAELLRIADLVRRARHNTVTVGSELRAWLEATRHFPPLPEGWPEVIPPPEVRWRIRV